jgi:hypothetical protein
VEVVAAFLTLVDEEGDEAVQVGHERSVRTRMKKKRKSEAFGEKINSHLGSIKRRLLLFGLAISLRFLLL